MKLIDKIKKNFANLAEKVFDKYDEHLHEITYKQLDDENYQLRDEVDELKSRLSEKEDLSEGYFIKSYRSYPL